MVIRILLLFLIALPAFGTEVAGVKIPDTDQQLVLNGAGLRKRSKNFLASSRLCARVLACRCRSSIPAVAPTAFDFIPNRGKPP